MIKLTSLLLVVALSACATQAIDPSYYLLRSDHELESRKLDPSSEFSMGSVVIAPYIDQPGLIMETVQGEVRPARHHTWAEPIYEGVRQFLSVEVSLAKGQDILSSTLGGRGVVVDVRIDQLHGTYDGQAKLVAYWWLRQNDETIGSYQFSESRPLEKDGYSALVAAEKGLIKELANSIAATLVLPAP